MLPEANPIRFNSDPDEKHMDPDEEITQGLVINGEVGYGFANRDQLWAELVDLALTRK
jgi:hypothetical protein